MIQKVLNTIRSNPRTAAFIGISAGMGITAIVLLIVGATSDGLGSNVHQWFQSSGYLWTVLPPGLALVVALEGALYVTVRNWDLPALPKAPTPTPPPQPETPKKTEEGISYYYTSKTQRHLIGLRDNDYIAKGGFIYVKRAGKEELETLEDTALNRAALRSCKYDSVLTRTLPQEFQLVEIDRQNVVHITHEGMRESCFLKDGDYFIFESRCYQLQGPKFESGRFQFQFAEVHQNNLKDYQCMKVFK